MASACVAPPCRVVVITTDYFGRHWLQRRRPLDRETYQRGLEIRSAVLGEEYVNQALANADEFTQPLQDLVTEYCWGAVWGRDGLALKTRSMLNLAMISVLNRPNELRTHVKAALTNGVTRDEIREIFLQVAIYAGVPAAVDSFRIAREAFAEVDQS
jgi:4-carboxymuconolactone decarboxylase